MDEKVMNPEHQCSECSQDQQNPAAENISGSNPSQEHGVQEDIQQKVNAGAEGAPPTQGTPQGQQPFQPSGHVQDGPAQGFVPPQGQQVDPAMYAAYQQYLWQQMAAAQASYQPQQVNEGHFVGHEQEGVYGTASSSHTHHLKHDEHKYGQMIQMAQRFLNGEANMEDVANGVAMLEREGGQFWRGLIAGGLITLVFTSETIREGIKSVFSPSKKDEEK